MKENIPALQLIPTDTHEWRFQESPAMQRVTLRFDAIWERHQGDKKLGSPLKRFLTDHPNHVDGLHHYAMHRIHMGHVLDGYAYAVTAVATAKAVFPPDLQPGRDQIPYGFVTNRPFHRAINGLMFAHASLGNKAAAIGTANEQLAFDPEDRMGVRIVLPIYLLEEGQTRAAIDIFTKPRWKDTFGTAVYLHALALLRLGQADEGRSVLETCVASYPQVARYIINADAPEPDADTRFGIEWGSEYEGWFYGRQYQVLWRVKPECVDLLKEVSAPFAKDGWKRRRSL